MKTRLQDTGVTAFTDCYTSALHKKDFETAVIGVWTGYQTQN